MKHTIQTPIQVITSIVFFLCYVFSLIEISHAEQLNMS